MAPLTGPLPV